MKRYLLVLLLPLFTLSANADDPVEINGIFYNLIVDKGQAQVQSIPNDFTGEAIIPESVEYGGVSYSVTSIGGGAFSERDGLTSVTIPSSVKSIGARAFIWSYNLATVNISDLTAWCNIDFEDGSSNPFCYAQQIYINGVKLQELIIPDGITCIKQYAFKDCNCTSVKLPNSVTSIEKSAFESCSMETINLPNNINEIGHLAFKGCNNLTSINIPNSLTYIGYMAFTGCGSLSSVTIPNSVTSIGSWAFALCGFTSITIPNSVLSIHDNAFHGCALSSIIIPNSVTEIREEAFRSCISLVSVVIGSSVTSVGKYAFAECPKIKNVYCYSSNTNGYTNAFKDSYIDAATLHVPKGSVNNYNASEPWKNFGKIVEIINVSTAGMLSTLISNAQKNTITDLTITGSLNGSDLLFIREMAGSDVNGVPTDGKLQNLDLSGATIVEGWKD